MNNKSISVAFLAAMVAAHVAAGGVIGTDERRTPDAGETTLVSALGLVFCAKTVDSERYRSAGTATVIGGPATVVTVAHVFTDRPERGRPAVKFDPVSDCTFRQYDARGDLLREAAFVGVDFGAFNTNPGVPNQDWAVLRTAAPAPLSVTALPFATSVDVFDELEGLQIKIVAFHADMRDARRAPRVSEGRLLSVEYGGYTRLAHTADSGRMSSGAAIVHRTEAGEYVVVGLNRSSANLGDFNLAVPLSSQLELALRSHANREVPVMQQRMAIHLR